MKNKQKEWHHATKHLKLTGDYSWECAANCPVRRHIIDLFLLHQYGTMNPTLI
jgi:hypothetical protein